MRPVVTTVFALALALNCVAPDVGAELILSVDFTGHPGGPYTRRDAIRDFNADGSGEAISLDQTEVVPDPGGSSARGNVLRITHLWNRSGGGPRFKAQLPAADEYYLAFDFFVPSDYELVAAEKLPGLMYGTLLDASHGPGIRPVPEGVKAFSALHQLLGKEPYPKRGASKLTSYVYDAERVQYDEFFDLVNPSNSEVATTWQFPKGRWVRIEQRIRQNTATSVDGVGDYADGILQEWVDGQLAVDKRNKRWRTVNTMHIDGIYMYSFYGGDTRDPANKAPKTQCSFYDNFTVSTLPITH
jgi:hypothetical protein